MKPKLTINQVSKILQINRSLRNLPGFYNAELGSVGSGLVRSWADFHYPKALSFQFYHQMYSRLGLAGAVIQVENSLCWMNKPLIKRNDKEDETFKAFAKRVRLWAKLKQLDEFQSVGHYAGAIIRVADGLPLSAPLEDGSISLDDIEDITPAWESQLIVGSIDTDQRSPRYGLPITYTYHQRGEAKQGQRDGGESTTVHYSRVWIMNEGAAGNTVYGTSKLERPYNSLISWANIVGAGGEGFLRNASARQVLQQLANGDQHEAPSEEQLAAIIEAMEDMQRDPFSAVPYLGGMELKAIQNNMQDPKGFTEAALNDVAAACGYSAKALVGAQEGVLAGEQDASSDRQKAMSRCNGYLTNFIADVLRWIDDKCSDFEAESLDVEFPDLLAKGDKEKLENAEKMARINQLSIATGGQVFSANEIREAAGWEKEAGMDDFDDEASEELDEEIAP